jgi:type III restriction enzyme
VFEEWLQIGKIRLEKGYAFSMKRPLYKVTTADGIRNALYMKEESMNLWELDVIGSVANLENIVFWTRNEAKKTFFVLNGAINHYPDFIAYTKSGKIILMESKGDHLDGSDSQQKIALGAHWEKAMHGKGFYFMIFKEKKVVGGFLKSDFLRRLSQL